MGTACLIDGAAEAGAPAGIVETDSPVKRHPELDRACIAFAFEHGIPLLIGKGKYAGRGGMSLGYIPGHKVRLQYLLSILIEKQVLGRQVHLRVCTSIIRPVMAGGCLGVYRLPDNALPCLQYPYQFLCLRCLINPPAIESAYLHGLSVTGLKGSFLICGIVPGRQVFHIIPYRIPVKGHAVPLSQKPLVVLPSRTSLALPKV